MSFRTSWQAVIVVAAFSVSILSGRSTLNAAGEDKPATESAVESSAAAEKLRPSSELYHIVRRGDMLESRLGLTEKQKLDLTALVHELEIETAAKTASLEKSGKNNQERAVELYAWHEKREPEIGKRLDAIFSATQRSELQKLTRTYIEHNSLYNSREEFWTQRGLPWEMLSLLTNGQLQPELKLSDKQISELEIFQNEIFGKRARAEYTGKTDVMIKAVRASMEKDRELEPIIDKKLQELLTAEQQTRLTQIERQQAENLQLLSRPDLATPLKLSADQQKAAESLRAEADRAFQKWMNDGRKEDTPEEAQAKSDLEMNTRHDIEKRALALLTDEQRALNEKLKGKSFEVRFRQYITADPNSNTGILTLSTEK